VTTDRLPPLTVLAEGVTSLAGYLQPDGTLHDPVFGCPTQYGSAYFGWCCAVLGGTSRDSARELLGAALAHTADPEREPHASGFDRRTLGVTGRLNHRDFTWPPILKTFLEVAPDDADLRARIAAVDVPAPFRARPPSNWAAVWMSGEWLRMQAGLSSTTPEQFESWVDVFFEGGEVGFDPELGMYLERGLPNSYDLFTRAHFTDLLLQGYAGRNRERLESFLTTGLRRSLSTQLSDGSMASGYRSAGQTWVLGAQVALFTASRRLGLGTPDDREAARLAAWRAFRSLASWQRRDGVFSPVQNLLPPELRVGYETYTSDGHYSPLALAFLATAIHAGFGTEQEPTAAELDGRPAQTLAEGAPSLRAVAHRGRVSIAVQAAADDTYDATGLVDLTFGSGRRLQLVSAARHLSGGPWLVPGLAVRSQPGASPVTAVGGLAHRVASVPHVLGEAGVTFETSLVDGEPAGSRYRWEGSVTADGVVVVETLAGWSGHRTLLVPYLRDLGSGTTTSVAFSDAGVRLTLGEEWVELVVDGKVERGVDLPYGYESRRGLCGLVRLDLAEPGERLGWTVVSSR
jgi:hypothetical protein